MATTSTTLNPTDGWVLIEGTAVDALIQCRSMGGVVKISFAATAPDAGTDNYHVLGGGEYIRRIGTDNVYAMAYYAGTVVTVSI